MTQSEHQIFEREVRRTAALIWGGQGYETSHEGKQIDGQCTTLDNVHYIEATVSRNASNARDNAQKLANTIIERRKLDPDRDHRGWIVTLHDPTADQQAALKLVLKKKKSNVRISLIAFDRFRSRLVDASHYLELRSSAPFGSAEDPLQGTTSISTPYVSLGLVDATTNETVSFPDVLRLLRADELFCPESTLASAPRLVLLGEYGAGKSMTLRELFLRLRQSYLERKAFRFPVLLNLREHHGQPDPVEALERHARNIGYERPGDLVRAWRAGFIVLLLDGFDEIAPGGWSRRTIDLRAFRNSACRLIREFVSQSPPSCPLMVAGRRSFFDGSDSELRACLGLLHSPRLLQLDEFTESQVSEFLTHLGWRRAIPSWLPRRPLLLGFMARRRLLEEAQAELDDDETRGWPSLIDRVCARESKIDPQLDGPTVKRLAEQLASVARRGIVGMGPIHQRELESAFRSCCGFDPTENSLQLLSRLFCLGPARDTDGAREFVDPVLADVLRAGPVASFVQSLVGVDVSLATDWQCPLGKLGMAVAVDILAAASVTSKQITAACERAIKGLAADPLAADIVVAAANLGLALECGVVIRGCNCPDIVLYEHSGRIGSVTFVDCIFDYVSIDPACEPAQVPVFEGCAIGIVEGPTRYEDAPGGKLKRTTTVEEFADSAEANAKVRALSVSIGRRVVVTILRKLFLQRGSGRLESAFVRGLSDEERAVVARCLELVRSEGFAKRTKLQSEYVWHPCRSHTARARECVARPGQSGDSLLQRADKLK